MSNVHSPFQRLKVVRQERLKNRNKNIFVVINNEKYEVYDYTSFSLAFYTDVLGHESDLKNVHFVVGHTIVAEADLTFVRKAVDDLGHQFMAYRISSEPVNMTQMESAIKANDIIIMQEEVKDDMACIPSEFSTVTYQLRDWLADLEERVNELEIKSFHKTTREITTHEDTICQIVSEYMAKVLPQWFGQLAKPLASLDKEAKEKCFSFFRKKVGYFLYLSYYANRAYSKPLGYAGDFEMMNSVYQKEKRGDSLFAKCVDVYFTNVPEAKAVRNRADFLLNKIKSVLESKKGPVKILTVASGPSQELQNLFNQHAKEGSEFHLIDQDESALQYSQMKLQQLLMENKIQAKIILHKVSIKKVIEQGLHVGKFDLIYSAGLFDYMTDPVAAYATKTLNDSLAEDGQLIIGNFNTGIPNEFRMSLIMDWHLIYRSKKEMERLFALPKNELTIEEEPEGINLFAVLKRQC